MTGVHSTIRNSGHVQVVDRALAILRPFQNDQLVTARWRDNEGERMNISRRTCLRILGGGMGLTGLSILAACAPSAPPGPTIAPAPTSAAAPTSAPAPKPAATELPKPAPTTAPTAATAAKPTTAPAAAA